jgi:hypothetical protein
VVFTAVIALGMVFVDTPGSWTFTHPVTGDVREKVSIDQQPTGDKNPGAGIVCAESGDDNGGNGFRKICLTHRSNIATIRTEGPNGDAVEFEFSDGVTSTPAVLSVKDGDGASGVFIQARDRVDSIGNGISTQNDGHPFVGVIGTNIAMIPIITYHILNTQPDSDIAFTFHDAATGDLIDRLYQENDGSLIVAAGVNAADPNDVRADATLTIQEDGSDMYIDYVSENPTQDVRQCFRVDNSLFCEAQIQFRHSTNELKLVVGSSAALTIRHDNTEFLKPPRLPVYENGSPDCNEDMEGGMVINRRASGSDQLLICMRDYTGNLGWQVR